MFASVIPKGKDIFERAPHREEEQFWSNDDGGGGDGGTAARIV